MVRRIVCLTMIFSLFFCYRTISYARESEGTLGGGRFKGVFYINANKDRDPQPDEYRMLKEELERLMEELKRLETNLRDKISKELLPLIRKEIEKLRERLREFQKEGDDSVPKKI